MKTAIRVLVILTAAASVWAKDVKVIELSNFRYRTVDEQAFEVKSDVEVRIEAFGASDRREYDMLAYGWILDVETREVVWEMTVDNSDEERRSYLRRSEDTIRLPKGRYEAYYAASPRRRLETRYRDLGDVFEDIFGGSRRDWKREAKMWGIALHVDEKDAEAIELTDMSDARRALVQLAPIGDDEYEKVGFALREQARVRVYAVGEGDDDEMYDYGWIVNASTGETVWEMDYWDTRRAGGAEKNRIIDEQIMLQKGDYVVHFVSDGSHSFDEWNTLPPLDPHHWGITLWALDEKFDEAAVVTPYDPEEDRHVVVDLTRMGNNRFDSEGFTLTKRMEFYVRCLGEYGYQDEFVDHGWILDARTREPVWEMTRRNTKRAGGSSKNRIFEGTITLDPGDYEVFYATDGSHSYRRWNAGPPYDPEAWGISITGAGDDFDPKSVLPYEEDEDLDLLVKITRVGDDERIRRGFQLDEDARVRVYAVGEGDDGEMYDYGWIENERGRIVWEMEYRDTHHAGGTRKNRMINDVVSLDAGDYTVFFRSDGSHSFDEWNASPPRDPVHWGILLRIER